MIKNITKRSVKTAVLLLSSITLGSVIAGAISVQTAIDNTTTHLRHKLPPLVILEPAFRLEYDEYSLTPTGWIGNDGSFLTFGDVNSENVTLTTEHLDTLADLSYVYEVYASTQTFFYNPDLIRRLQIATSREDLIHRQMWVEQRFNAFATSNPNISHFEENILEIIEGRLPTAEELRGQADMMPIVIPRIVAQVNELYVGGILEMYQIIPSDVLINVDLNHGNIYGIDDRSYTETYAFARMSYEFEIVGIFDWVDDSEVFRPNPRDDDALHRIMFIPMYIAEEMALFHREQHLLHVDEMPLDMTADEYQASNPFQFLIQNIFVLYNLLYLDNFMDSANALTPDLVNANDLSTYIFGDIIIAMEPLQSRANLALLVTFAAIVIILGLFTMRLLYNQRHKFLASGDKMLKTVVQIISEVLVIAFIGFVVSFFIGNTIARQISQPIVRDELAQLPAEERHIGDSWSVHETRIKRLEFEPQVMSHEEMLAAFDVSLDARTIITFAAVGLGAVIVSTALPAIYFVKMSPKKKKLDDLL